MGKLNWSARKYLLEIKRLLPGRGKRKKEIMLGLSDSVKEYLDDNPGADYAQLISRFGHPRQIVLAYLEEMENQDLLSDLRIKRSIVKIIAITSAVIITVWLGIAAIAYINHVKAMNGFHTDEIVEGTVVQLE